MDKITQRIEWARKEKFLVHSYIYDYLKEEVDGLRSLHRASKYADERRHLEYKIFSIEERITQLGLKLHYNGYKVHR